MLYCNSRSSTNSPCRKQSTNTILFKRSLKHNWLSPLGVLHRLVVYCPELSIMRSKVIKLLFVTLVVPIKLKLLHVISGRGNVAVKPKISPDVRLVVQMKFLGKIFDTPVHDFQKRRKQNNKTPTKRKGQAPPITWSHDTVTWQSNTHHLIRTTPGLREREGSSTYMTLLTAALGLKKKLNPVFQLNCKKKKDFCRLPLLSSNLHFPHLPAARLQTHQALWRQSGLFPSESQCSWGFKGECFSPVAGWKTHWSFLPWRNSSRLDAHITQFSALLAPRCTCTNWSPFPGRLGRGKLSTSVNLRAPENQRVESSFCNNRGGAVCPYRLAKQQNVVG